METETCEREYQPELIPRRGEWVAWACTGLSLASALILRLAGQDLPWTLLLLILMLLLASSLISLGNWVDRSTRLTIGPDGVEFENGLRRIRLAWGDVREVRVFPSQMGDKIQVLGEKDYFQFRTLGEVHLRGELKGRMGFAAGDSILRTLVLQGSLRIADRGSSGYYYVRQ